MRGSYQAFRFILTVIIFGSLSCGHENDRWPARTYVENIPIITDITLEEVEAVTLVEQSIREYMRIVPPSFKGLFFVRDPNQKMPEYCKGPSCDRRCADTWKDYPKVNLIPEKNPGLGYGGMTGVHIYISRIGPYADHEALLDLLVHERMHEITGLGDTPEHARISNEVKEIVYRKIKEQEQ